jgi:hypothetical protein
MNGTGGNLVYLPFIIHRSSLIVYYRYTSNKIASTPKNIVAAYPCR